MKHGDALARCDGLGARQMERGSRHHAGGDETRVGWRVAGAEGQASGRRGKRRSQERRSPGHVVCYRKLCMRGEVTCGCVFVPRVSGTVGAPD
eukprot:6190707-Pleurochrysis_carterae.AAC.4